MDLSAWAPIQVLLQHSLISLGFLSYDESSDEGKPEPCKQPLLGVSNQSEEIHLVVVSQGGE